MVLPKTKLHQLFFYLLILLLPTQLGKHFWPDWTMVLGLRLDYLSPTIYFTDILILGTLISWFAEKFTKIVILSRRRRISWLIQARIRGRFFTSFRMTREKFFLFSFLIFLFVSCFFAQNQPAAFYKLVKLAEFVVLGIYIIKNSFPLSTFYFLLSASIIYSSLLAIFQFINQSSIGGIFYWLGERSFTSGTPGIAQTIWDGRLLLRPYATFPHPNVLAGFLVISLLLIIMNYTKNRQTNTAVVFCPLVLGVIALFLTFSRVAWMVFVIALLVKTFYRKILSNKKKIFFTLVFLLFAFYFLLSTFPIQSESIIYRQDLNLAAIKMWQSFPLVGVGLNNFLVRLPEFYQNSGEIRWFQPAHNLFLMVLAEMGAIGGIGAIGFLFLTFRRLFLTANYLLLTTLAAILALSLFDHYFYTLQQGQILLTIILGMCWMRLPRPSGSQ